MAGKWKHGYIPLDATAALEKAHGSKSGAAKALTAGKGPAKSSPKRAPKVKPAVGGQLSKTYVSGKGATRADVATLIGNYTIMHGKPPTAKQVAKIKRAK
jgi:hypothetical protein